MYLANMLVPVIALFCGLGAELLKFQEAGAEFAFTSLSCKLN